MCQIQFARILPLLDLTFEALDGVGRLRLDRVSIGHLNRGRQNLRERHRSVLGEHRHQSAGSPWGYGGEWTVLRRIAIAFRLVIRRSRPARGDSKGIDADDLLRFRVVNQRLSLAAP